MPAGRGWNADTRRMTTLTAHLFLLRRRARSPRGFTLIEVLVVLSILGVMATLSVSIIESQLNGEIRQRQTSAQAVGQAQLVSWMSGRLARATSVGLPDGAGGIDPLTLAGDQIVFTTPDGACHRLLFIEAEHQLRARTSASGCDAPGFRPSRGPNQAGGPADAGLDEEPADGGATVIAENVALESAEGEKVPLLAVLAPNDGPLAIDAHADTGNPREEGDFYSDETNAETVDEVLVRALFDAGSANVARANPQPFRMSAFVAREAEQ